MENFNEEFDPEMSEYNPIFSEIAKIKEKAVKKEDTGFIASLIEKLTNPVAIQMD